MSERGSLARASIPVVLIAGGAALAVAILAAVGWPAERYRDGDFFQFWAAGRMIIEGGSPYDLERWAALHAEHGAAISPPQPPDGPAWTTPYPLWTLALAAPVALLPLGAAAAAWLVAQLAFVALGLAALVRGVLVTDPRRDGVLLVGIAIASQPAWLLAANGNLTGALLASAAWSLALWSGGRWRAAGAAAGLFAMKPQSLALFGLALLLLARRPIRFFQGAALAAMALAGLSIILRPGWVAEWLPHVAALQGSTGSNATIWTLDRAIHVAYAGPVAAAGLVALWLGWLALRRPDRLIAVAVALSLSIVMSPHGWSYDQLLLLPAVAVALERVASLGPRARLPIASGLALVVGPLAWILYAAAFGRGGEDLFVAVPIAVAALVVAADEIARRRLGPTSTTGPQEGSSASSTSITGIPSRTG